MKKPDIYKYKNIFLFLNDLVNFHLKKENISLRDLSLKLNISVSLISMNLNQKRVPTKNLLKKFYKYFNLSENEYYFLLHLNQLVNSKSLKEKNKAVLNLSRKKQFRDYNKSEYEFSQYLSNWYNLAIKELTHRDDFKLDSAWIQKNLALKVSKVNIEKSLKFLLETGIIKKDKNKVLPTQKYLQCEDGVFRLTLGSFHQQILEIISKSIEIIPREQRKILGYTMLLNEENKKKAELIIEKAFQELKELDQNSENILQKKNDCNQVYHFELAYIPLTKKVI